MVDYPICPKCEAKLINNIGHFFDYLPDGHGKTIKITINYCLSCGYPITTEAGKK